MTQQERQKCQQLVNDSKNALIRLHSLIALQGKILPNYDIGSPELAKLTELISSLSDHASNVQRLIDS